MVAADGKPPSISLFTYQVLPMSAFPLCAAFATLLACSGAAGLVDDGDRPLRPAAPERAESKPLKFQGRERSYRLFVPTSLVPGTPAPLVLVFHGSGSTAEEIERITSFSRLAAREGFLVAYPQGVFRNWNDGRGPLSSLAHLDNVNDVAFVDAVVLDIERTHPVDRRRIYATGLSNGGCLAHHLAAARPDLFAAIATVAGSIAQPLAERFEAAAPVSVFLIHGSADPITPVAGGGVLKGFRGRVAGTVESARLWARIDGCDQTPDSGTLQDRVPEDGCTTRWFRWRNADQGVDVTLFLVDGMGHTWPGHDPYLPERLIGRSCYDFDATALIWQFFVEHPKAAAAQPGRKSAINAR
jgi:polyhydroxybutyrate depolymerase